MIELDRAARTLQDHSQPARLDAWRRRARERLTPQACMTLSLIPPVGWSPTIIKASLNGPPEELLDRMRATPRRRILQEMTLLAQRQRIPTWATRLPDERDLQEQFYQGMYDLWSILLAPHWPRITGVVQADRSLRMRQFADGGVESLLAHANPRWMRWQAPVLAIRMANGVSHDLHLDGRGLLLAASAFADRTLINVDNDEQPILTYPALDDRPLSRHSMLTPPATAATTPALTALLGRTRSAVLQAIAEHPACSTKELAMHTRIAPASASEHATILRGAGLIRTQRRRDRVLHSVTALGIELLTGQT